MNKTLHKKGHFCQSWVSKLIQGDNKCYAVYKALSTNPFVDIKREEKKLKGSSSVEKEKHP